MPSADIELYFREFPGKDPGPLSRMILRSAQASERPRGIRLQFEHTARYQPAQGNPPQPLPIRWADFRVSVEDFHSGEPTVFGRVPLEDTQSGAWPSFNGPSYPQWFWYLSPGDVEAIDNYRSKVQARISFRVRLRVEGVVQIGTWVVGVRSGDQSLLEIATSEWDHMVEQMKIRTTQSVTLLAGSTEHPSWHEAEELLATARSQVRAGEGRDVLGACLSAFEALTTNPYDRGQWAKILPTMPKQKREAIQDMLGGFGTYLNRVGHHRARTGRDGAGNLEQMPLDQWEAQLGVGISQLLLTYAKRLRAQSALEPKPEAPAPASTEANNGATEVASQAQKTS